MLVEALQTLPPPFNSWLVAEEVAQPLDLLPRPDSTTRALGRLGLPGSFRRRRTGRLWQRMWRSAILRSISVARGGGT